MACNWAAKGSFCWATPPHSPLDPLAGPCRRMGKGSGEGAKEEQGGGASDKGLSAPSPPPQDAIFSRLNHGTDQLLFLT